MRMTSNFEPCNEGSSEKGRNVGGNACAATAAFLSRSSLCCLGYLRKQHQLLGRCFSANYDEPPQTTERLHATRFLSSPSHASDYNTHSSNRCSGSAPSTQF